MNRRPARLTAVHRDRCELCDHPAAEFVLLEVCKVCVEVQHPGVEHSDRPTWLTVLVVTTLAWAAWLTPAAVVFAVMH